jgi:hypothetical protein
MECQFLALKGSNIVDICWDLLSQCSGAILSQSKQRPRGWKVMSFSIQELAAILTIGYQLFCGRPVCICGGDGGDGEMVVVVVVQLSRGWGEL